MILQSVKIAIHGVLYLMEDVLATKANATVKIPVPKPRIKMVALYQYLLYFSSGYLQ